VSWLSGIGGTRGVVVPCVPGSFECRHFPPLSFDFLLFCFNKVEFGFFSSVQALKRKLSNAIVT